MLEAGYYHMDCMEGMSQFPDKFFDLAIVDPIYGGVGRGSYMKNFTVGAAKNRNYCTSIWEQPKTGKPYFDELFRVSENQIIWGGNYFIESIGRDTQCMIVWDKNKSGGCFADCEIAWTSFDKAARIFRYTWNGMLQENMKDKEERQHPTQKPVALYKWLLANYARPGNKILDTHVGSASSLIACYQMGYQAWGFELDADYYEASFDRLRNAKAQISMVDIALQSQLHQTRMEENGNDPMGQGAGVATATENQTQNAR